MAKVLQCPQCGHRHPLATVPDAPTFACEQCGRALKVPGATRTAARAPTAAASMTPDQAPVARPAPVAPDVKPDPYAAPKRIPWWLQALIWIIALIVGFCVTYYGAILFGFLTRKELRGVALYTDFGRYWPLLRLLPVWALVTALLVQGAVVVRARRSFHSAHGQSGAGPSPRTRRRPPGAQSASSAAAGVAPGADARENHAAIDRARVDDGYRPVRVGSADAPRDLPPPSRDQRSGGRGESDR